MLLLLLRLWLLFVFALLRFVLLLLLFVLLLLLLFVLLTCEKCLLEPDVRNVKHLRFETNVAAMHRLVS